MDLKGQLFGDRRLRVLFKQLPKKLQKEALFSTVQSGGYVMAKEVKKSAPVGYHDSVKYLRHKIKFGGIKDNVTRKRVKLGNYGEAQTVGISKSAYYAPWIEKGLPQRPAVRKKRNKEGKKGRMARIGSKYVYITHCGGLPARPFFWPAVQRGWPKAFEKMNKVMWQRIVKQVNVLSGPYKKYRKKL